MSGPSIAILGAGSFGTAVAVALMRHGQPVTLFCRTPEQAEAIEATRENRRYFPGHLLPAALSCTADLDAALAHDILFLAFPAKHMDRYADLIAAKAKPGAIVINLVKGLHEAHFTFADLYAARAPAVRYVALKGPTFARPLLLAEWSGLTCGTGDVAAREMVKALFARTPVVLDFSDSAAAVDVLSALKNIYAIVLGVLGSTGPSENTIYLFVTAVLKEIGRIVAHLGYESDVILSFAGMGDTLLTGLCDTSRNRTVGLMMGKGIPIDTTKSDFLAEGVRAVGVIKAHIGDVHVPLLHTIAGVLAGEKAPAAIFEALG
jgi:glycerol-3-phosphate dehydrogenase (NAD(P)+)